MHLVHSRSKWSLLLVAGLLLACSSTNTIVPGPPIACEDSICATGNACIMGYNGADDEKAADPKKQTLTCRLKCDLDPTNPADVDAKGVPLRAPQDKCPSNFHCSPGGVEDAEAGGGTVSYCVPDRGSTSYAPAKGQWGTPCNPQQGFNNNPACDTANTFWCYAETPDDASAICTQYQCNDDFDCKGGYFCATINTGPSATTLNPTVQMTTTVCLPRTWNLWQGTYCSPCKDDVDCPLNGGILQHCVGADGQAGMEKMCAAECASDKNCNLDNKCVTPAEGNVTAKVCVPRAATCKGDGSICSPCRSDTDCPNGVCTVAEYSTERFCTVKSTIPCTSTASQCPPTPTTPPVKGVGCFTKGPLANQCIGETSLMGVNISGCWTPNR